MNALEWPEGEGDGERVVVHTKRALGFSMTATNVPRGRKRVYLYTKNCVLEDRSVRSRGQAQ